ATVGDIASSRHSALSLAFDSSTNTFAIASDINLGEKVRLFVSTDGGSVWATKTTFEGGKHPSLSLVSGNLHLAYVTDSEGLKYVTGRLSADASTWQTRVAPEVAGTDPAINSVSPSLALDNNGTPGIAYWTSDSIEDHNRILLFWRPAG